MRASVVLRPLFGVVGIAVGTGLAVWLVLWVSLRTSAVQVPSVQGLETSRAVAVLQEAGLLARQQDGVFDANVPIGRVARQRPPAGFETKRGATVLVYPSLGKASQRVEDFTQTPLSLADAALEDAGLAAGLRCEVDGQADSAVVIAQSPAPGALVPPGSEVALLVNRTPREKLYVAPDFTGVPEQDAARVIQALGFRLAPEQRVSYPGVAAGVVLRQEPGAGGPIAESAPITLWVSR